MSTVENKQTLISMCDPLVVNSLFPHECSARMDSAGTVEVGGPAGCLHGDFGRDLTNASGQAQHSLAQGGSCWYSEHLLWGDSLYLDSWVAIDIHLIFNVIFSPLLLSQ